MDLQTRMQLIAALLALTACGPQLLTAESPTDTNAAIPADAGEQRQDAGTPDAAVGDRRPPRVSWSAPASGATLSGSLPITSCEVAASDDDAVVSVEFFVDGRFLNRELTAAYNCRLDTLQLANGAHQLEARAVDPSGNATSALLPIMVQNASSNPVPNSAPAVHWVAPTDGAHFELNEPIPCEAVASDPDGVAAVRFHLDGIALGADEQSPYQCTVAPALLTRGPHRLEARAADPAGNATSAVITVTWGTSASVSWQSPTEGQTVSGVLEGAACQVTASSEAGISRVEFSVDGAPLNVDTSAPYNCRWDTAAASAGEHELKAIAWDASGLSVEAAVRVNFAGDRPEGAKDYYVSGSGDDTLNTGMQGSPWKTIGKINRMKLNPGDVVHLSGTVNDAFITSQKGTEAYPITFQGEGTAIIKGILLEDAAYLHFVDLEAKGYVNSVRTNCMPLVHIRGTSTSVHDVTFTRLKLHDSDRGVLIGNHCARSQAPCPGQVGQCCNPVGYDLRFEETQIDAMSCDGFVFDDFAGDRISLVGGSITNTGLVDQHGVHGIYSSGGHGHLVDGITFQNNHNGWGLSIRRGGIEVRNNRFLGCADGINGGINNNNEDEGTEGARGLLYKIHRNLFTGNSSGSTCTSIYQSTNNDVGIDDPRNTWAVFNNTFVNTNLNFSGARPGTATGAGNMTGGCLSDVYDIYLKNNVFVNGRVGVCAPVTHGGYTHVHQISNNGFFGIAAQGSNALTANPALNSNNQVTNADYIDQGTAEIIPNGLVMVPNPPPTLDPLGYWGAKPDVGQTEQR